LRKKTKEVTNEMANKNDNARRKQEKKVLTQEETLIIQQTPGGVPGKSKTKRKASGVKLYFHSGTQDAIVAYQTELDKRERDRLYVAEIMPAFEKLVENLINIHKFVSTHDTYDNLKNDCINFLFETISKFDGARGTNAFSYFNVVAKNWLIVKTKQRAQNIRRNISLDDPSAMNSNEFHIIEEYCTVPSQEEALEKYLHAQNIIQILYDIRDVSKTENELMCINSIITIFENINDLDLLNKSAVLLYMRELTGLSPKQLTSTIMMIKKQYKRFKFDFENIK